MEYIYTARRGAENLLRNCAAMVDGESLLIVHELATPGWYDSAVVGAIAGTAADLGIECETLEVGAPQNQRDPRVDKAMQRHDCTLFLSRIGDQDRFAEAPRGKRIVMCYLRNADMLASGFAGVDYAATQAIKRTLDGLLASARRIEVTCPMGTSCSMEQIPAPLPELSDVSVRRFPLGVVTPIDASALSGRVALVDFLTPTGSQVYQPPNLLLPQPAFATVDSGRITGFEGPAEIVASIEAHYDRVARLFEIDPARVHSWHIGLHPGLHYDQPAAADPDRWSNTVFNHPRILHFHTCGAYPPGEISWNLKDATLCIDGEALWYQGRLRIEGFEQLDDCLRLWPELRQLYQQEPGSIGI